MITGFNTDIEHGGVTYHVQTEDKGVDTPLILSLVYVGGAIIASKRTPYDDLVSGGYDEKLLTERLQRQHKLICAAIRAGRVEELKKMGERGGGKSAPPTGTEAHPGFAEKDAGAEKKKPVEREQPIQLVNEQQNDSGVAEEQVVGAEVLTPGPRVTDFSTRKEAPNVSFAPRPESPPKAVRGVKKESPPPAPALRTEVNPEKKDQLYLSLLDDPGEFRAGQLATIKIHVGRGSYGEEPVREAAVTVKVLGTTFKPITHSASTDGDGVAVVRSQLPRFSSGRAAIVISANAGGETTELRRIVHQS